MNLNDILASKNRRIIYNYILAYPGIHLSEIVRQLDINEGTTRYHIKYLKDQGLIENKHEDGYTRYYIPNKIGNNEKIILNILRKDTPCDIALYLLVRTTASQKELSISLEKDPSTISYHLKKLLKLGIIKPATVGDKVIYTSYKKSKSMKLTPSGREIIYILKDPYLVYNLFVIHKDRLFDNGEASDALDLFKFLFPEKKPKKLISYESGTDRCIKIFSEFFPLPFCA